MACAFLNGLIAGRRIWRKQRLTWKCSARRLQPSSGKVSCGFRGRTALAQEVRASKPVLLISKSARFRS